MPIPSRQQIRTGFLVVGFILVPIHMVFGEESERYRRLRERQKTFNIASAFVDEHQGGIRKHLSKKEQRKLRDMEAQLKQQHGQLYKELKAKQKHELPLKSLLWVALSQLGNAFKLPKQD